MYAGKRNFLTLSLVFSLLLLFFGFADAAVTDITADQTATVSVTGGDGAVLHGVSVNVTAGYGLHAEGEGTTISGSADVRSNKYGQHAVYANDGAVIVLEKANILAAASGSSGVYANNGANITITGNIISTGGTDTNNIAVVANNGSSATVSGTVTSDAAAVLASYGSTVTVTGGAVIKSSGGSGVQAANSNSVAHVGNGARIHSDTGAGLLSHNGGVVHALDDIKITGASGVVANSGTTNIGNGLSVDTEKWGIRTTDSDSVIKIGDGASIKVGNGYGAEYGIDVTSTNSEIRVGDRLTLEVKSGTDGAAIWARSAGKVYILDDAKITAHAAQGIFANNAGSEVHIGDRLKLYAVDSSNGAVFTHNGGKVYISDNARISSEGIGLSGRETKSLIRVGDGLIMDTARSGIYAENGAFIEVGRKLYLDTKGTGVHAIKKFNGTSSKITISDDATIKAGRVGILAENTGEIIVGKGLDLTVNEGGETGILGRSGGNVTLYGGKVTMKDTGARAVYAAGSAGASASSTVKGNGVFDITGDMYADQFGIIDLTMDNGSRFVGAAGYLNAGASASADLTLNGADTLWNITRESYLTKLNLDKATVDFQSSPAFMALTVEKLSPAGSGTSGAFIMRADIPGEASDQIIVTDSSSSGFYNIKVLNTGDAEAAGDETVTLATTAFGSRVSFGLANIVECGAWQYGMNHVRGSITPDGITIDDKWQLRWTGGASTPGSGAINSFAGSYLMAYADTQTLIQRMGDLRQSPYGQGLWFRVHGGKFESNSKSYVRGFEMDYGGVQIGYDRKIENKWDGELYVGAMFGYGKGDLDYHHEGSGKVDSKTLGIYGTYIASNGWYVDTILKYQWMTNDFDVIDTAGTLVRGQEVDTGGIGASVEIGKRVHLGDGKENRQGWYVEPQIQLSYQRQDGGFFNATNGLRIGVDSFTSLLGRVGMLVGYETDRTNLYAKVSKVKEYDGDLTIRANGIRIPESFEDEWWVYGIGCTSRINDRNSLYLDIERTSGGSFSQPWRIFAGWRVEF